MWRYLLEQGGWRHLVLPAIAEAEQLIPLSDDEVWTRPRGHILHEERESRASLDSIRKDIGSYNFAAQYQQVPVPIEGHTFRRSWFQRYSVLPPPDLCSRTVLSVDTAQKTTQLDELAEATLSLA